MQRLCIARALLVVVCGLLAPKSPAAAQQPVEQINAVLNEGTMLVSEQGMRCLTILWGADPGSVAAATPCDVNNTRQYLALTPNGEIRPVRIGGEMCLTAAGNQAELRRCDGGAAQRWTWGDDGLRTQDGRCLTVGAGDWQDRSAARLDGGYSPIVLELPACADARAQRWYRFAAVNWHEYTSFGGSAGELPAPLAPNMRAIVRAFDLSTVRHADRNALNFPPDVQIDLGGQHSAGTSYQAWGEPNAYMSVVVPVGWSANPVGSIGACLPRPRDLAFWWPGDGSFADKGPLGNSAVNHGVIFSDGKVGQAFWFRGDETRPHLELQGGYGGGPEMTVAAWVNLESAPQEDGMAAIVSSRQLAFAHLQMGSSGNSVVYTDGGDAMLPPVPAATQQWQHVAITARSGQVRLYVNGALQGESNVTFSRITNSAGLWAGIGYGARRLFRGAIDEILIVDRALGRREIRDLHAAASYGVCK